MKKYLKIFFLYTVFAAHSVFSLSEDELKYQFQQLLTKSVDASIYDSKSSLKRSFDLFLKLLLRMSNRPSLQINFVNLFFYKAVLLGMVSMDDISLIGHLYASTRDGLDQLLDRAKAQIWENLIDPEKEIDRIEGLMIALLAVFDSATSSDCFFCSNQEVDEKEIHEESALVEVKPSVDLSVVIPQDSLSGLVKKVERSSSGATSASVTPSSVDSKKSSRKCCACDYYGDSPTAVDARKRRGVFIVTARQLIKK